MTQTYGTGGYTAESLVLELVVHTAPNQISKVKPRTKRMQ